MRIVITIPKKKGQNSVSGTPSLQKLDNVPRFDLLLTGFQSSNRIFSVET